GMTEVAVGDAGHGEDRRPGERARRRGVVEAVFGIDPGAADPAVDLAAEVPGLVLAADAEGFDGKIAEQRLGRPGEQPPDELDADQAVEVDHADRALRSKKDHGAHEVTVRLAAGEV